MKAAIIASLATLVLIGVFYPELQQIESRRSIEPNPAPKIQPTTLFDQAPILEARKLKQRMPLSTQRAVEKLGNETVLWRRYGLQMKLLEEDLVWLNRGYTERQILIVQAIVLARTLERADSAIEQPASDAQKKYRTEMCLYRESGYLMLKKMLKELGKVEDKELRFQL